MSEKKYPIGGYAPGNYHCRCGTCGGRFIGDKRAYQCEPCALNDKAKFDALSPAEQEALMKRNAEAMNEMLSKVGTFTTEHTAELPVVDNARYELSLALHMVLKVFKNVQRSKEQEKYYSQAEAMLKKHSKITDVLRIEVAESPSKEGNKVSMDWIDVNDRLPELETKVIVLRPNEYSKKNDVLMAYLHDSGEVGRSHGRLGESKWLYGHYWSLPAIVEFKTITHWLPLPVTPQYNQQKEGMK